ncbi:MAG TPA: tetratricopeptide repeat protein [Stenomitos sp.]
MTMSHPEMESNKGQAQWLAWLQGASIAGAVGGAIAGGQSAVLFSALPLSLAAALSLVDRRNMQKLVQQDLLPTIERQAQQIHQLEKKAEALVGTDENLMNQLNKTHDTTNNLGELQGEFKAQMDQIQLQIQALEQKQMILIESTLEESYCRRGMELEKRKDYKNAIVSYNEALRVNPTYAECYMQLGSAYAHIGQKQQAITNLRTATKLFFESGDLDNYHKARALTEEVHSGSLDDESQLTSAPVATEIGEKLAVNELFV